MPLTVITLRNSIPSLRGDLSKWMQEIATGVYIGNFNSRIREKLWQRVLDSVGSGEATLSYAARNELGYYFETYNTKREVIDADGIPLVLLPKESTKSTDNMKYGFSNAAHFHKARKFAGSKPKQKLLPEYVVLDIETSGLDHRRNSIIEIGAIKISSAGKEELDYLIRINSQLPKPIVELTGITDKLLDDCGIELGEALEKLIALIGNSALVGYNIRFDIDFLNMNLKKLNKPTLKNKSIDLMNLIKKENKFLSSYRLESVLKVYGIESSLPHRALQDARLIYQLAGKVNNFNDYLG